MGLSNPYQKPPLDIIALVLLPNPFQLLNCRLRTKSHFHSLPSQAISGLYSLLVDFDVETAVKGRVWFQKKNTETKNCKQSLPLNLQ